MAKQTRYTLEVSNDGRTWFLVDSATYGISTFRFKRMTTEIIDVIDVVLPKESDVPTEEIKHD